MTHRIDIEKHRALHAEAVANAGGDFEVDTDEAFRLACMTDVPAMLDELEALRAVADRAIVVSRTVEPDDDVEESVMDALTAALDRWRNGGATP
jgi:hypothetical protein